MNPATSSSSKSPESCSTTPLRSGRSLRDLVKCPVCLESYQRPKTLKCLHTFCEHCLVRCKKTYTGDICCPVCKKVTALGTQGVAALPHDFRIDQIRDVLLTRSSTSRNTCHSSTQEDAKYCQICKSEERKVLASCRCVQCILFFCNSCREKHTQNSNFTNHHVVQVGSSSTSDILFCNIHSDQPIRFFCEVCYDILCPICSVAHDPTHKYEPLERKLIKKYTDKLKSSFKCVKGKIAECERRTEFLDNWKKSYDKALSDTLTAIRQRTENAMEKIREEGLQLMSEAKTRMEVKLRQSGVEQLHEVLLRRKHLEELASDLVKVIAQTPDQCLIAFKKLNERMTSVYDTKLRSLRTPTKGFVQFIPGSVEMTVGTLDEPTTCPNTINADEILPLCTSSTSSPTLSSTEPATSSVEYARKPVQLMKIDTVGTWSGNIMTPSGVAFLPNGNLVVAEGESRLQVFNQVGHSVRVIGWSKIKPVSVAVTRRGLIAVTDLQDRTVKIFDESGKCHRSWEPNKFQRSSGIAVTLGGIFVVTDIKCHTVSVLSPEGELITRCGSKGRCDCNFNHPSHVVVDRRNNLMVSHMAVIESRRHHHALKLFKILA